MLLSTLKSTPSLLLRLSKRHPLTSFTFLVWGGFFSSYWLRAYTWKEGAVYAKSLATWADGAAHLTYISAMAYQPTFPRYLPIYWGEPFFYPFLSDWLSAVPAVFGVSLFVAYSALGLILSLIFLFLLYLFYYRFTRNHITASLSVNLLLSSGGLGFYYFFQDKFRDGFNLTEPLLKEYTRLDDFNIVWLNIITGELLPQRALLLGFIFGTIILLVLWPFFHSRRIPRTWQLVLAGTLLGLLPITHPHTLIALSPAIFWIFLFTLRSQSSAKAWLKLLVPAVFIGLPLLFTRILPQTGDGFFRWYPGWIAKTNDLNWLWFWFLNWGLLPVIAMLGALKLSPRHRLFLPPFILIFVIANLFLFQPYDWDNSKVLTWVYLILAPLAASYLHHLFKRGLVSRVLALFLFVSLTLSGAIDLSRQLLDYTTILMFTESDIEIAEAVKRELPADGVFLTSEYHLHPIPTLTGRQIVYGYPGWIWTYGIDYRQRESDVTVIYQGQPRSGELLAKYHVDYVVIGPHEYGRFNPNIAFFEANYPAVLKQGAYTIFQIN